MREDHGFGSDKWDMEQLEAEIQALLHSPVPMDPDFKGRLRTELLQEHRRLYGRSSPPRWRWPFGIVSGTAAAALLFALAGSFWQGEAPLQQADLERGSNGFVWEQSGPSSLTEGNGTAAGPRPHSDAEENIDDAAASDVAPVEDRNPDRSPAGQGAVAQAHEDADGATAEPAPGREDAPVAGLHDGQAVAMGPVKETPKSGAKPTSSEKAPSDAGVAETKPVREFVFSSSSISMSSVAPLRADALPANVELNVDESKFPAKKPVFGFDGHVGPDKQRRLAIAQALGLGDKEEVTAKGYRYRGADGSTLLFSNDGFPTMEYVYRGELSGQDGRVSIAANAEKGGTDGPWMQQAEAFLQTVGVDVTSMKTRVQAPSAGSDKWIITFIPELDGTPNLAEAVTVHMKQGTVVEARIPMLFHVHEKQPSEPLIPLTDALQRVVFSEEYLIHPDEKVVFREAELVYYAFGNDTLAPAYQLRGEEQQSGKRIQLIVSAVMAKEAGK